MSFLSNINTRSGANASSRCRADRGSLVSILVHTSDVSAAEKDVEGAQSPDPLRFTPWPTPHKRCFPDSARC